MLQERARLEALREQARHAPAHTLEALTLTLTHLPLLLQERARFEAEALREQARHAPAHTLEALTLTLTHLPLLLQERARFEAEALREQARHAPAHVPAVHRFDAQMALIVMAYLPPPHSIVRGRLTAGAVLPELPAHVAEFMAATLFGTSLFALDTIRWRCAAHARGV